VPRSGGDDADLNLARAIDDPTEDVGARRRVGAAGRVSTTGGCATIGSPVSDISDGYSLT